MKKRIKNDSKKKKKKRKRKEGKNEIFIKMSTGTLNGGKISQVYFPELKLNNKKIERYIYIYI